MKLVRTIRDKLVAAAIIPVLLMAAAAVFTAFTVSATLSGVGSLFEKNLILQETLAEAAAAKANLSAYMGTKNSDNLRRFIHYSRLLSQKAAFWDAPSGSDKEALVERNIAALLAEFIAAGDAAVQAKRGRNIREYGPRYDRVEELAASIRERADTLVVGRLDAQLEAFTAFDAGMRRVRVLNALSIAAALLFGVSIILYFTLKIASPIAHLGMEANKIARGEFDDTELAVEADDEIGAAAYAFNLMKKSIKDSIDGIRSKAEVERALMEERVKNLEMAGLLRNAELAALQARINPHFLFNTLNAGVQLAVVEEADRTRTFLERLTRLMRYSFRDLEAPVALHEEIDCLQAYLYLMSIRFPDVFQFSVSVETDAADAAMPKMIIQPIVENAVQHGLQDRTSGALLTVRAFRVDGDVRIVVEDNGHGIARERVDEIFQAARDGRDLKSSGGGGLGLVNVICRLRLFSGRNDVLSVESLDPSGTRVTISIPYREEY
jgi:nitrogen fixation/metabolism regulation signal transduction histidine kinase